MCQRATLKRCPYKTGDSSVTCDRASQQRRMVLGHPMGVRGDASDSIDLLATYWNLSDLLQTPNLSRCVIEAANASRGIVDNADFRVGVQACIKHLIPAQQYSRPFVLSSAERYVWIVMFSGMVLVSTSTNASVIWVILGHRRMRNVTNYFLLNLAVADLLMSTLNTAFNFAYMLESHWFFGQGYCTLNNFTANLTVAASVFTICAMSIDRYMAIVRPLLPRMLGTTARAVIAGIWFSSALFSLPTLLYSSTVTYRYPDGSLRTLCFLLWPDGPSGVSQSDHIYNVLFLLLTYVVPLLAMAFTYPWMGFVLWGSRGIGEALDRQKNAIKSKQRVVRMLLVVVILFAICWLPYHVYFLYTYHNPHLLHTKYIQHVYLAIYWLAMCNAMVNPLVIYTMNARFRNYFRTVILCRKQQEVRTYILHDWNKGKTESVRRAPSSSIVSGRFPVNDRRKSSECTRSCYL